jgi:hypothetical protein
MLEKKKEAQAALFYEFCLEDHVPPVHLGRNFGNSDAPTKCHALVSIPTVSRGTAPRNMTAIIAI